MDADEKPRAPTGAQTNNLPSSNQSSNLPVLPPIIMRGLSDKFYDKRKQAALEVERIVREFVAANDLARLRLLIESLTQDFAYSVSVNARNGGLIALAATAIALGTGDIHAFLNELMKPVLACLLDQDGRVRYYACESLYNISKVARGDCLRYFNEIFDALSKLAADPEMSVKNGADLLDRLIKDIVAEYPGTIQETETHVEHEASSAAAAAASAAMDPLQSQSGAVVFNLNKFIPLLSERIYTVNPFTRSFLISWLTVLDSIPQLELLSFLPAFIDGLLGFVSDENEDVRQGAVSILNEFLREIREIYEQNALLEQQKEHLGSLGEGLQSPVEAIESGSKRCDHIAVPKITKLLIPHTRPHIEELTRQIALTWLTEFVRLAGYDMVDFIPELVSCVLPCLAERGVRMMAEECDLSLRGLVVMLLEANQVKSESPRVETKSEQANGMKQPLDIVATVNALTLLFLNDHEKTRVASLEWLLLLHQKAACKVITSDSSTFPALLKTLSDPSDSVVKRDLSLLAAISQTSSEGHFERFLRSLLDLFSTDRRLLELRGSLIVRILCNELGAERIYRGFSEILSSDSQESVSGRDSTDIVSRTTSAGKREEVLDLDFISLMVQNLNLILLTSGELAEFRRRLRNLETKEAQNLFVTLYKSWSHNPVAVFSLCLLTQAYDHAAVLLQIFTELEMSVPLLIQIDKLVQLLESPVFSYLRIQLLDPEKYPNLYKCLYGLLMLLPQSSAFVTLRNRLNSVSSLGILQLMNSQKQQNSSGQKKHEVAQGTIDIKFAELITHFKMTQSRHERARRQAIASTIMEPVTASNDTIGASEESLLKPSNEALRAASPNSSTAKSKKKSKLPRFPISKPQSRYGRLGISLTRSGDKTDKKESQPNLATVKPPKDADIAGFRKASSASGSPRSSASHGSPNPGHPVAPDTAARVESSSAITATTTTAAPSIHSFPVPSVSREGTNLGTSLSSALMSALGVSESPTESASNSSERKTS